MESGRAALFFAITLLGGCRCNREPPPAPVATAPEAAPPAPPAPEPKGLRVVATMASYNGDNATALIDPDGTIYVVASGIAYEARDGALVPLLPSTAYTPMLPAESVPFVGWIPAHEQDWISYVAKDAHGNVRFFGEQREWRLTPDGSGLVSGAKMNVQYPLAFRGGLLALGANAQPLGWIGTERGDGGSTFRARPPRSKRYFASLTAARDGTLVAPIGGAPEVAIWRPGAALDAGEVLSVGTAADAGRHYRDCKNAPSFDGNVYVCCESSDMDAPDPTMHRLEGRAFVEVFVGTNARCLPPPSIDRAGNLYRIDRSYGEVLERCAPGGSCERVPLETEGIRTPRYSTSESLGVQNQRGDRYYELYVHEDQVDQHMLVRALYARAPDDIWVIATGAVLHNRGPGPAAPVLSLPTRADARVRVQNEHPPLSWTKECDAVFVELAAGSSVDAGASTDQAKIAAVLGKGFTPAWNLVTGRLHDREVAGVVIARNNYDQKREEMNEKIEKLVDELTRDPMNVPRVYCTLPVLSRAIPRPR